MFLKFLLSFHVDSLPTLPDFFSLFSYNVSLLEFQLALLYTLVEVSNSRGRLTIKEITFLLSFSLNNVNILANTL